MIEQDTRAPVSSCPLLGPSELLLLLGMLSTCIHLARCFISPWVHDGCFGSLCVTLHCNEVCEEPILIENALMSMGLLSEYSGWAFALIGFDIRVFGDLLA